MMTFLTIESMTFPNAAPMTTPTARSIMLPLRANALNSVAKLRTTGTLLMRISFGTDRIYQCRRENRKLWARGRVFAIPLPLGAGAGDAPAGHRRAAPAGAGWCDQ